MTPSERIEHIRNIAAVLSSEDWSVIDLTLKQFSLPWTDEWEGSERDRYIIDMIGDADELSLLALAKHAGVASELQSVEQPAFWQAHEPRVFISHVSKVRTKASSLATVLGTLGINAFVAHEDIEPTAVWESEIQKALSTMDALVALLSEGFRESNWTDQEVGVAVGRGIPVIPIKVDLDPYGFIGKWQALVGKGKKIELVAEEIRDLLLDKPGVGTKIADTLVDRFSNSNSWAEAKENMTQLEKCRHLSPELARRLRKAAEINGEIKNAFGVPERVQELLSALGT